MVMRWQPKSMYFGFNIFYPFPQMWALRNKRRRPPSNIKEEFGAQPGTANICLRSLGCTVSIDVEFVFGPDLNPVQHLSQGLGSRDSVEFWHCWYTTVTISVEKLSRGFYATWSLFYGIFLLGSPCSRYLKNQAFSAWSLWPQIGPMSEQWITVYYTGDLSCCKQPILKKKDFSPTVIFSRFRTVLVCF